LALGPWGLDSRRLSTGRPAGKCRCGPFLNSSSVMCPHQELACHGLPLPLRRRNLDAVLCLRLCVDARVRWSESRDLRSGIGLLLGSAGGLWFDLLVAGWLWTARNQHREPPLVIILPAWFSDMPLFVFILSWSGRQTSHGRPMFIIPFSTLRDYRMAPLGFLQSGLGLWPRISSEGG
jgi:hypothetical protein